MSNRIARMGVPGASPLLRVPVPSIPPLRAAVNGFWCGTTRLDQPGCVGRLDQSRFCEEPPSERADLHAHSQRLVSP
jgi:hypothetical protein